MLKHEIWLKENFAKILSDVPKVVRVELEMFSEYVIFSDIIFSVKTPAKFVFNKKESIPKLSFGDTLQSDLVLISAINVDVFLTR